VDLRADYLIKSGYVLYDQAIHDQFTDSPLGALDAAAERFSDALSVRKSWNQAQLYLAITSAIQSGVAIAQSELAVIFEEIEPPVRNAEALSRRSNELFELLLGEVVLVEAPKLQLSEAEAFLKAARDLFRAAQAKDAGEPMEGDQSQQRQSEKTEGEEA